MRTRSVVVIMAVLATASAAHAGDQAGAPAIPPPAPPAPPPPEMIPVGHLPPQPQPQPMELMAPEPPHRHGLLFGGGGWGGNISCNGSSCSGFRAAGGLSGHIGYAFSDKLAALVDIWAMTSKKNDTSITFVTGTIDLRLWLAPALWIQGGLGNGHAVITFLGLSGRGDDVPVAELAAGFELVRHRNYALSLSAKVAQGTSAGNSSDPATTGRMVGLGADLTVFSH